MANWIAGAIKHKGSFRQQAHSATKSVAEYAREKASAPGITGKRARLALTLRKLSRGASSRSSGRR